MVRHGMASLIPFLGPTEIAFALCVACVAGVIKGVVGFAMPMVLIVGLGTILPPELALAGLILPTLVTNTVQALRQGGRAAVRSVAQFKVYICVGGLFLFASAQMVLILPQNILLLILGVPVTFFVVTQLVGLRLTLRRQDLRIEALFGSVAGFIGGLSGVWGPPTVAYLTALDTPKREQMLAQGVIYGLGAVGLLVSHLGSGVLRAQTLPFSLVLVVPALLGMWIGGRVQDRIDQEVFRKATLIVLLVAGLNLVRRGLMA